jgi:3-deoxy-D-manno-octulosonic-acid transferase
MNLVNYLNDLREQQIPTYLVSGIFRENQMFLNGMAHFIEN